MCPGRDMAKQISQETYDDAVKENIEDFDMAPQDAIDDAISQFEAQVWGKYYTNDLFNHVNFNIADYIT